MAKNSFHIFVQLQTSEQTFLISQFWEDLEFLQNKVYNIGSRAPAQIFLSKFQYKSRFDWHRCFLQRPQRLLYSSRYNSSLHFYSYYATQTNTSPAVDGFYNELVPQPPTVPSELFVTSLLNLFLPKHYRQGRVDEWQIGTS